MTHTSSDEALRPDKSTETSIGRRFAVSQETWIAIGLLILTLAAYLQVARFEFVTFDDPLYITRNPTIQAGLNWKSLGYAFTTGDDGSYLPLVWLSHAACVSLFKTWAGGHHLVNLLLHCANSVLLFYFLKRMTKSMWPSATVAFLFALHPLHVESVAWVAERKDVLSTLFWILTSWAYVHYVDQPSVRRYLGMTALFILGLLSKSMLVTLPLTLLFLDVWPLQRVRWTGLSTIARTRLLWSLILEKCPMLALSAGAAAATFYSQRSLGAVVTLGGLPLSTRLGNAALTTIIYLRQTIWPSNLSAFYPFTWLHIPTWRVVVALVLVLVITGICILNYRRRPYLAVGWFWYLITLLPVVGIVQVGSQAHADRYTYVPLIGIFLMLSWLLEEFVTWWRLPRRLLLVTAASLLGALFTLTAAQTFVWKDNLTLFKNALSLDTDNPVALMNIGDEYMKRDQYQNAYAAYYRALKFSPGLYLSYVKTGVSLDMMGRFDEALHCFRCANALKPGLASVDQKTGHVLVRMGRFDEAEPFVKKVIQRPGVSENVSDPVDTLPSKIDWATILTSRNRVPEAFQVLQDAFGNDPKSPKAGMTLAEILHNMGRNEEALQQMKLALDISPKNPAVLYQLGVLLAQLNRFSEAREMLDRLKGVDSQSTLFQTGLLELEKAQRRATPNLPAAISQVRP